MADLHETLEQIRTIRRQMARGTEFQGYGPETVAATGLLAIGAAALQALVSQRAGTNPAWFLMIWTGTAVIAACATGIQTVIRTRRIHPDMTRQMLASAAESFLPPIAAAVLLTLLLLRSAPLDLWLLPGLWQIFYGLGILASCRFVPRQMLEVGIWYQATGVLCIATGAGPHALSPWEMGFPFGVGQLLIAAVLMHPARD